jgi:hypothetical protein
MTSLHTSTTRTVEVQGCPDIVGKGCERRLAHGAKALEQFPHGVQSHGWSAPGRLTCNSGSPVVFRHSKGKATDSECPGGERGMLQMKPGEQSPWSSRHTGLGPKKQECWGKARFVKLQGCQPQFETRLGGGGFLWFTQGECRPRGGLALCVAKPMVDTSGSGLTSHGESTTVSKPSEGKAMDLKEWVG